MNEPLTSFELPARLRREMLAHLLAHLPEEACGLLGGSFQPGLARAERLLIIENELHSPVRYRMNPAEQLKAFEQLEQQGLELVATFHSHPAGPPHPSPTDLGEFAYPGVLLLICQPVSPADWQVRAFEIEAVLDPQAHYREVTLIPPAQR